MTTEMKLLLSAKESLLLVLTLLLVPILIAELFGVSRMRSAFPAVSEGESEDGEAMPRFSDLLVSAASAVAIIGLRLVLSAAFKPLGRRLLSPDKRSHSDRVERFATVLFKFLYVSYRIPYDNAQGSLSRDLTSPQVLRVHHERRVLHHARGAVVPACSRRSRRG